MQMEWFVKDADLKSTSLTFSNIFFKQGCKKNTRGGKKLQKQSKDQYAQTEMQVKMLGLNIELAVESPVG